MFRLRFLGWVVGAFLFLWGCVANNGLGSMASSEINVYNMSRLSTGMKQSEVLALMKKPYKCEKFEINDLIYDVWFYVTRPTVLGQSRMVPQNLTPLTFKNGVLVGWGFAYYNYLVKKEDALFSPKKSTPVKEPEEDKALEKALQSPPSSSKTPIKPVSPQKPASTPPAENKQPKQNTSEKTAPSKAGGKVSAEKPQPLKTEPIHTDPMDTDPMEKPKFEPPDRLEDQKFEVPNKTVPRGSPKPNQNIKPLSMSSTPKKEPSQPIASPKGKKEPPKKPLIEEEDQEMLEDASDQNFNQTQN